MLRGIKTYGKVRRNSMQFAVEKRVEKDRNKLGVAMYDAGYESDDAYDQIFSR